MTYTQPLMLFLLGAGVVGLCLLGRRSRGAGWWLAAISIVGMLTVSWPPVSWLLAKPLERPFPVSLYPRGEADAIVVLGGGRIPASAALPEELLGPDAYERCARAAWLYRHWRQLPVITSGGLSPDAIEPACEIMRRALSGMGIPREEIWTECQSGSTHENARLTSEMLRRKGIGRIVLVTSAYHMLRAARCFEKEGLRVVPAACAYARLRRDTDKFLPGWASVSSSEDILHEVIGLVFYRLRGWI